MSNYLRDNTLKNLLITEARLITLDEVLTRVVENVNILLPPDDAERLSVAYIFRFDNKGFLLDNFEDLIRNFRSAKTVQKVIIVYNTENNRNTPGIGRFRAPFEGHGKSIFIQLAQDELTHPQGVEFEKQIVPQVSTMIITDDNQEWVEGTFLRIKEELDRYRSYGTLAIRTPFVPTAISLVLMLISFLLSLLGALKLSRYFHGAEAPTAIFVLLFIIVTPVLSLFRKPLVLLINRYSPNIAFRERRAHWLVQAIVGVASAGTLVAIFQVLYIFLKSAMQPYLVP